MRQINEAATHGWKSYCTPQCLSNAKDKRILFTCFNPICKKIFKKRPKEVSSSGKVYCSQSCAAIESNKNRWLKLPQNHCANPNCKKVISRSNKFCSNKCNGILKRFSDEEYRLKIIKRIKQFYINKHRIPFKKEMWGSYGAARRIFGTWNSAIEAAGLLPNPVKFAMKYLAKDGHKCDSLSEKIIDDWLFKRKIHHEIKVPYGINRMTADFKVKDVLIEFFGLQGELKKYDSLMRKKLRFIKKKHLHVIPIYPTDLFPKSRLNDILSPLKD